MTGGSAGGNPASNPMGSTASSIPGTMNQGGYLMNTPSAASPGAQTPQWLKGMQLGQQISQTGMQMAQQGQRPQMPAQMAPRPMMQGGAPQGMQQGVVPGSVPQMPMGPGMASGGMGMPGAPNSGQQQLNPQLLQMLMRQQR
jgi:hypothetical protein